jgi:transposase
LKLEEGWRMYNQIQDLKKIGLNKSQISRKLGISRPTVKKYINMSPEEYDKELRNMRTRAKRPDQHQDTILMWLKEYHDMSAAQIYDRLEEKHGPLGFTEGTVRRYVRILRTENNIPKHPHIRPYLATDDPPMGKHMKMPDQQ